MSDTVTLLEAVAEISINDGPQLPGRIVVEQEIRTEWSMSATKPDPTWTHIDQQQHYHAYDDDGELPTLTSRRVHLECDGLHVGAYDDQADCDGYDVTEWHCRICGEHVEPGRVSDAGPFHIPARKSWHADVYSDRPAGNGLVSVRALTADRLLFGAGHARIGIVEYGPDGSRVRTDIIGASPLGTRTHR